MAATARAIEITAEDLESTGGSSDYEKLEVPNDYYATVTKVEDYDNSSKGGSHGWVWFFDIEGLEFRIYTAFSKKARWKLVEVLESLDIDLSEGIADIDPNAFVGDVVGAHVDFPKDYYEALELGVTPERSYREIRWTFKPPSGESPAETVAAQGVEPI